MTFMQHMFIGFNAQGNQNEDKLYTAAMFE